LIILPSNYFEHSDGFLIRPGVRYPLGFFSKKTELIENIPDNFNYFALLENLIIQYQQKNKDKTKNRKMTKKKLIKQILKENKEIVSLLQNTNLKKYEINKLIGVPYSTVNSIYNSLKRKTAFEKLILKLLLLK
jgi:hypothetical protein